MHFQINIIIIFNLIRLFNVVIGQCSVNIRNDLPEKDPVYIKNTTTKGYQLWSPDGPSLLSKTGEIHLLTCSGTGNFLTINLAVTSSAKCKLDTKFLINKITTAYASSSLACLNTITGDTENTGQSCNDNGTLINIGFQTITNGFITYIQSCYNMDSGSTYFTKHILPGRAINYAVVESARPAFKTAGSAAHTVPAISYTQTSQLGQLTLLLGSATEASKYIYTNSYLARGHLTPDADGIYRSWQFTTYFYTNVAPQWQVFNAGNWLTVENAVRTKADQAQEDFQIFTGTHGILTLPHANGNQIPITLEAGGNIEVPKWFWKIMKFNDSAIVLIGLNNPFVNSLAANEMLCPDICLTSGWFQSTFSDFSQGFVYCCDVNQFKLVVSRVPNEATAKNILYF